MNTFQNTTFIINANGGGPPALPPTSYPVGFVTGDAQDSVTRILNGIIQVVIDILGVFTNVGNIVIFVKIGLKDSVTVSLFALAFSDLGYLLLSLICRVFDVFHLVVGLRPYLSLDHIGYLFDWYSRMCYDISIVITVFTAVQKCACVAIPLVFSTICSRRLAIVTILCIYLALIIYYMPLLVSGELLPSFDTAYNRTRLRLSFRSYRYIVLDAYAILNRMLLPFVSQVLVMFCMIILTFKLKQASKVRHEMTHKKTSDAGSRSSSHFTSTNPKERRVIKLVNLVSAIFVVCNLPDILIYFCILHYPEFSHRGKYRNTYYLVHAVQDIFAVTGATINILVYHNFNTKYREKFREIFW